jgi:hypothetical protein
LERKQIRRILQCSLDSKCETEPFHNRCTILTNCRYSKHSKLQLEEYMDLMCVVCGKLIDGKKALRRRLNGKIHLLCGIACEVKWEKQNMVGG